MFRAFIDEEMAIHAPNGSGGVAQLTDAPWGMTLAAFALQRRTGELVVCSDDRIKEVRIALIDGVAVAASSVFTIDSVARIALTGHLVTSSQVSSIQKRLAASPDRDEIDVVAELARLPVEQAVRLRQRVITQRTARTFAIERGTYQWNSLITLKVLEGIDVDICPAIYQGIHLNLAEVRLGDDMRRLGSRFEIRPKADVKRFGFSDAEHAIVESLRIAGGASLPELDARHRDIVPRTQQAIVYALVACGACEVVDTSAPDLPAPVARERNIVDLESRVKTTEWQSPAATPLAARSTVMGVGTTRQPSPAGRDPTPGFAGSRQTGRDLTPEFARSRTQSGSPLIPRTITPRRNLHVVRETIARGLELLAANADHFTLLGVDRDARLDTIRSAYVQLACQLHKDKLPVLDADTTAHAQRVFAAVNIAFATLCDPVKRAEYLAGLRSTAQSLEVPVDPATLADVSYRRGLAALARDDVPEAIAELRRAVERMPDDVDYAATLAWARFCGSSDKHAAAPEARRVLQHTILESQRPALARFYLGRVERMLGRVREALHHFREVLEVEPGHADAAAEIRLLEPRSQPIRRR
jgi:DnaJ-domain-containing protein 1